MKVSSSSILSLALVLNGALASPLRARDYAVVTVTEFATEVVHITATTWVDPAQYNPTEAPPSPTINPNEKHKNKSHVLTSTPSTTLPTTTPTTISTPSTSIPTTTSLPTTTSIPTTTSELPTSIPSLLPTSTSISVPTSIQVPPTTLETSTLPIPTTSISIPPVKIEPSTTAPAPAPTSTSGTKTPSGSGGGATYSGQATFYNTGLGSCGVTSQDTDFIVAIAAPLYDAQGTANPNNNPLCGKKINVSYNGGAPVTVTIRDRCPECATYNLDLSPAAFKAMGASPDQGRVDVTWSYAS